MASHGEEQEGEEEEEEEEEEELTSEKYYNNTLVMLKEILPNDLPPCKTFCEETCFAVKLEF